MASIAPAAWRMADAASQMTAGRQPAKCRRGDDCPTVVVKLATHQCWIFPRDSSLDLTRLRDCGLAGSVNI